MLASFAASLLILGSSGSAKTTEPALPVEFGKFTYSIMRSFMVSYDEKQLTERAMVYVYNYSGQTLLNPVFQGTLTVGTSKYKGTQIDVKMGSPLPGSFFGVLPHGVTTHVLVTFKFPIDSYYFGRRLTLKLVAAQKMKVNAPLTEANALRQFLIRSTGPQITQAFKKNPNLMKVRDQVNMPPMGMAILTGAVGNVKALEAAGLKIEGPYPNGMTALHLACDTTPEMIAYIKKSQTTWSKDKQGYNPLFHTIYSSKPQNIKALSPTKEQLALHGGGIGSTPLHDAIAIGEIPVIKTLIALGANPNTLNARGEPPLVSTFNKSAAFMELIISIIKPDFSIKMWKPQYSLLQWAVFSNEAEAAGVLMKHGLNPHDKNADGQDCFDILVNIKHPVDREQMRRILER